MSAEDRIEFVYIEARIPKGQPIMLPEGVQVLSYKRVRGGVEVAYMCPRAAHDRANRIVAESTGMVTWASVR